MSIAFGTVLPWLLLGVWTWLGYQLLRQNGRILLRLQAIEQRLASSGTGARRERPALPSGSMAPDFELPDLDGVSHKLSDFRGREVLLIFIDPKCGFCTKMAPELAALAIEKAEGRALPVIVTTGNREANRKLVERHGMRCPVLLQNEMEVASRYQAQGTPMGYRLDAGGRIASALTVGAEPLLKLFAQPDAAVARPQSKSGDTHHKTPDPSLARSRLNRNGLQAGTEAPDFRLPRLDGGELSLSELRGRRVLLVFSDPNCGPCDELAPLLEDLHVRRKDLQIVVISRRDADAARAKAASLGLHYPIVMQKQWEISLKYGMFATPISYLIDEQGVLLSNVAVGVEPILALVRDSDARATHESLNGRQLSHAP